jgi:nondiscriminating glutamyl-tRNA synthetase
MNGEYMRKLPMQDLIGLSRPWLERDGLPQDGQHLEKALSLEKDKVKLLSETPKLVDFFFKDVQYDPAAVEKVLKKEGAKKVLEELPIALENAVFEEKPLEERIRAWCTEKGLKTSQVFHPIRVAVSGRTTGPSLFGMMEVLGSQETIKRMRHATRLAA